MAKRVLGKGLGALLSDIDKKETEADQGAQVRELNISEVEPNKNQPRKEFDSEKLQVLSESIKRHGVISPIIVKRLTNGYYQIVAGERRWRASRMAGLKTIPAIVRDYDALVEMEVALVENLQREDLNPIEEALGYQALLDKFDLTQEEISKRVAKSRSAVANALRLLALPDKIQKLVSDGSITSGHARAILSLEDPAAQLDLAVRIMEQGWSVRQAESFVQSAKKQVRNEPEKVSAAILFQLKSIESDISSTLGTKVKISHGVKKGKIEIEYYGSEDLSRIINLLKV